MRNSTVEGERIWNVGNGKKEEKLKCGTWNSAEHHFEFELLTSNF
jgi:hypothetical protein